MNDVRLYRVGIVSTVVMCLVGLSLLWGFVTLLQDAFSVPYGWEVVEGVIVDADSRSGSTYRPVVEYEVEGEVYTKTSQFGSSSYPDIGAPIEVAYDPNNVEHSRVVGQGTDWLLPFGFLLFGLFLVIYPVFSQYRYLRRKKDIESLRQYGLRVDGIATGVHSERVRGVKGVQRLDVVATDPSGVGRELVSDRFMGGKSVFFVDYDKEPFIVDVYFDPNDFSRYYVDLQDIPEFSPDMIAEHIERYRQLAARKDSK